jgi:hypothetical protein
MREEKWRGAGVALKMAAKIWLEIVGGKLAA